MPVTLDTRRAWKTQLHGDLAAILTWASGERALILLPWRRPGAPWFVVMESAAYTWDDRERENVLRVVSKSAKACDVLGIEPTPVNCRRVASIVIDTLEELVTMPSAPPAREGAAIGQVALRADGQLIAGQDVRAETSEGASYG